LFPRSYKGFTISFKVRQKTLELFRHHLFGIYSPPLIDLTECFTDLGKPNFANGGSIRTASKNEAQFKSGQNQLKNNHLASLI